MAPIFNNVEIFAIVFLALLAVAAIVVPWYRDNPPRWGTAFIILLLTAPLVYEEYRMQSVESFLTSTIREYGGNPEFQVECDRISAYLVQTSQRGGEVWFDADGVPSTSTQLMYRTCDALKKLPSELPRDITMEEAYALHIVSHELQHLLGIKDEAVAECYAHQHNPKLFNRFGVSNSDIVANANWSLTYKNLPDRYKSGECRDGGTLDLNFTNNVFRKP